MRLETVERLFDFGITITDSRILESDDPEFVSTVNDLLARAPTDDEVTAPT